MLECLKQNSICHADFNLRNVGIDEKGKLKLYDMDAMKFLDPVCLEPKAVFADTPAYMEYMKKTSKLLCYD